MDDRRRFDRENIENDIILVRDGRIRKFKIFDCSQGGISFISGEVIEDGAHIQLVHTEGKLNMVVLEGSFEWLSESTSTPGYKIRCKFNPEIPEKNWADLKSFLLEY